MTRREKQVSLTELCAKILTDIRSGLHYNARYRDVGTGRRAQDEIMGDPAYYLETYFAPEGSSRTLETTQGAATRVEHRFQVSLWLEYEDSERQNKSFKAQLMDLLQVGQDYPGYEQSSQSEYDRLVEGTDGLLTILRGKPVPAEPGHPNVDGWPAGLELGQPDPPSEPIVDLDNAGRLAHLCRFEIPLIHSTL